MEIKKINSLEELENFSDNTRVNVYNPLLTSRTNGIYLGKEFDQEERCVKHSFISYDSVNTKDKKIVYFEVFENNVMFNQGTIKVHAHKHEFLNPGEDNHKQKLKIIQGGNK